MAEKNIYISYLRVIATIFVVLIHASTGFLNNFDATSFNWNYANWINSATRCSVPIFVTITGALLLAKEESTQVFYKNRFPKLLFPFAFWTIIYLIYYFSRYTIFANMSFSKIVDISIDKILHGSSAHLWYLYMITGLYIAIPFIKKIVQNASTRELEIFLTIWFLATFVNDKQLYAYMPKIDLNFFTGYLGYLILGYYISIKTFNISKVLPYILYGIIVLFTGFASLYVSSKIDKYDPAFYYYLGWNTMLATLFLFLAIKVSFADKKTIPNWLLIIDEYSFSIYLIHILPLNYIHPWVSKYMDTLLVIPTATILTIIASIFIAYLLKLLPGGKYVSG